MSVKDGGFWGRARLSIGVGCFVEVDEHHVGRLNLAKQERLWETRQAPSGNSKMKMALRDLTAIKKPHSALEDLPGFSLLPFIQAGETKLASSCEGRPGKPPAPSSRGYSPRPAAADNLD